MRRSAFMTGIVLMSGLVTGCVAPSPPDRVQAYLGQSSLDGKQGAAEPLALHAGRLQVGLLVIDDTTGPDSAAPLSEPNLAALTSKLRKQLESDFPMAVMHVIRGDGIVPDGQVQQFVGVATEQQVDYLMLAIFSSDESEIPVYLGFQVSEPGQDETPGAGGDTPGYRAQNYALVELALLEGTSGRPLVQAHGRAWASLDRLAVPTESNIYPVVRRSLSVPPIFPTEDEAYNTLRAVSADDALNEALMHLKKMWAEKFRT